MTNPNKGQLYDMVANALSGQPAKQPVTNSQHVDTDSKNDQKKVRQPISAGKKIRNVNAFSFNKTYPVSIIHKAQSKIG